MILFSRELQPVCLQDFISLLNSGKMMVGLTDHRHSVFALSPCAECDFW